MISTHRLWNVLLSKTGNRRQKDTKYLLLHITWVTRAAIAVTTGNAFTEGDITPFVEMYSRHGLAESDQGDYPYLHDMGPRQWEGTIQYGLELGNKFGIMASTDQHSGYPGKLWRRSYRCHGSVIDSRRYLGSSPHPPCMPATGDKIIIDFRLNDAFMGDVVRGNSRRIYLNVTGESLYRLCRYCQERTDFSSHEWPADSDCPGR